MALPATVSYVTFMKVESSSYLKIRLDILYSVYIVFAVAIIVRYLWAIVCIVRGEASEEPDGTTARLRTMNPTSPLFLALVAIVGLSLIGLPIGYAMIGGSILWLFLSGIDMGTAAEQLLNGMMASQLLLAIPLFILAASFMSTGSILDRLLQLLQRDRRALPRRLGAGQRPAGHRPREHVGFRARRRGGLGQADADDDDARTASIRPRSPRRLPACRRSSDRSSRPRSRWCSLR